MHSVTARRSIRPVQLSTAFLVSVSFRRIPKLRPTDRFFFFVYAASPTVAAAARPLQHDRPCLLALRQPHNPAMAWLA